MRLVRWDPLSADDVFNRMMPAMFGRLPRMTLPADDDTKYEGPHPLTSAKPTKNI